MPKPKGPNSKQIAGRNRKLENQAKKDEVKAAEEERLAALEWKKGSNMKKAEKDELKAMRSDEIARKRQEKQKLLAAEEQGMKGKVKTSSGLKKKKKGNDTSLLDEALLVGNADKKAKAAKKALRQRQEREERLRIEREKNTEAQKMDPLMATGSLNNHAIIGGGTIEDALEDLSVGAGKPDAHPEKRMKALHKAFEERMLPQMKEEHPGLRLGQYKERMFALWKKSPENPMNWPKDEKAK